MCAHAMKLAIKWQWIYVLFRVTSLLGNYMYKNMKATLINIIILQLIIAKGEVILLQICPECFVIEVNIRVPNCY